MTWLRALILDVWLRLRPVTCYRCGEEAHLFAGWHHVAVNFSKSGWLCPACFAKVGP